VTEVVTGEAVVLEVPCARFPSRMVAFAIDVAIQFTLIFILLAGLGLGATSQNMNAAAVAAIAVTIIVLGLVGYPIVWETATRGRSPGKFALGLRVVSDDGGPERFRQALVRGLATVVDFWLFPFLGVPALICSLLSAKGKRLGDVFAGTFVIQQRLPARHGSAAMPAVPPGLTAWAAGLELSGLSDQTAAMARRYLGRLPELTPGARAELGERIATAVWEQVSPPPPPGTPAPTYLAAVLAERHRREHARLMARPAAAPPAGTPAWAGPAGTPAWAGPAGTPTAPPPAPPPTAPASQWAAPGSPAVPAMEWMGAAREEERAEPVKPIEPVQSVQPAGPVQPGEPASPPAAGTGFVPPQ
jgi:uncharacterized RDD family membrane protein YckC